MTVDLTTLNNAQRLLFAVRLKPLQGQRFQPTGFPNLGAATYRTGEGQSLLVESAQSMANRLEMTIWDEASQDIKTDLQGLSHVRVLRGQGNSETERNNSQDMAFFTDSITESHRINSPYIMFAKGVEARELFDILGQSLNAFEVGPLPARRDIAEFLLRWDVGSLLHGVFLSATKGKGNSLAGGRLRISRAISAFIEADGIRVAASGGVKNDHVNPSGDTKSGFGNVPFARDEFTADSITLYVNLDLSQIRGYGLNANAERLLVLLALFKLRVLLDGNLRLRTACDLQVATSSITASQPAGFALPSLANLLAELRTTIAACGNLMTVTEVTFNDELKKGKEEAAPEAANAADLGESDTGQEE